MSDMDCSLSGAENKCEWCHGNRPPANVVAPPCHRCHGTGTTRDNAECQTCGGNQRVGMGSDYSRLHPCPDCTPENVECRSAYHDDGPTRVHGVCPYCGESSTPENVDSP